ncbi:MAG: MBG domain-containing protein, partial [Candidatus Hydromicrobium sp.]|nr:MBG domain-containing protein [Candidatus Hydromicrobium sp.]
LGIVQQTVSEGTNTVDASSVAGAFATITGSGGQTVKIEKISSATASERGFSIEGATSYVDLHLDTSEGVEQIQFTILGGAGIPWWWNGSSWRECSNYTIDAAGNVTITITGSTTPSLSDLTGTVFTVVAGQNLQVDFTPTDTANYNSASKKVQINVGKATLTLTGNDESRLYGAANPAFTGTVTGQQNGDSITATWDCSATPSSLPGTYPIVPTLVDPNDKLGNYDVTINNGTLTVLESPCFITIIKTDAVTGLPIDGATFNIYDDDGVLKEIVTTANGGVATVSGFKWYVKYSIVEVAPAPAGYLLNTDVFTVTFGPDLTSITIFVKDTPAAAATTLNVDGLTEKGIITQALGFTGLDAITPIAGGFAVIIGIVMTMLSVTRKRRNNWKHAHKINKDSNQN